MEDAAGPASSLNINEQLTNITLRKALKIVLRPHELDFCILDDALYITTQDEIKNNPDISTSLQLYGVADLIMQPNQMGAYGGTQMGGGNNSRGGMGGGMGGFGGGMGGFGGGMGGGGMFSVPQAPKPAAPAIGANANNANDAILQNFLDVPADAGEGLFSVPVEPVSKNASKAASKATGSLAQAPVDLNAKWDAWFAANAPKADADQNARDQFAGSLVVQTQKLMNSDPASAAAFLRSAMRNDCASEWMYEALAAALIK